jgi:putative ABC transport system substrate-binding protein
MEHPALDAAREGFMQALADEGILATYDYQNAQGDRPTLSTIAQRFVNNAVDMIFAIATGSAQAAASETTTIPIIGSAITDYEIARLVDSNEVPGGNVTGASDMMPVAAQVGLIPEFVPGVQTIGILYSSNEPNSVLQAELAVLAAEALGLTVVEGTVTTLADVQQVTISIANRVDAIYIPTDNTYASSISLVAQISIDSGVPVFAADVNMVMTGGVATLGISYFDLGYQSGMMAAQVLRGEAEPATMPIQWAENFSYTVNGEMVELLGMTVPARLADYVRFPEE